MTYAPPFSTPAASLSGRIVAEPSALLHDEVLEPQFVYERQHLLPWYVQIERVLLLEYVRLGAVDRAQGRAIAVVLGRVNAEALAASPQANMSDIAFAIERFVEAQIPPAPGWHVDRSRNDFQACAQVLFGREQVLALASLLMEFAGSLCVASRATADMLMPGYTHFQAAQVISPGFYLAAMADQVVHAAKRLLRVYDDMNRCPLGAGAMAGQELPWDRERMAALLGFAAPVPHALVAVASREWVMLVAAELSLLGTALSRFATDFLLWGSSEYQFIDLPDSLSGVSSAMPQKKNFPVLERIRGKTAHLGAFYVDLLLGQRNTPFTNLVEVSKEASANFWQTCRTAQSMLRLFITVIDHVQFAEKRMRRVCDHEFLGGFALANHLTLRHAIPTRTAQVIAGHYVVAAMERGLAPAEFDAATLETLCARHGFAVTINADAARQCMLPHANMTGKTTAGSTHPDRVRELVATHEHALAHLRDAWQTRRAANQQAYRTVTELVATFEE